MIPYIHIPSLKIYGPLAIQPFGVMVSLAVLAGYFLGRRRCEATGFPRDIYESSMLWLILPGFIAAHLVSQVFYFWNEIAANPLSLLDLRRGYSSFGGFFGATASAWFFMRQKKIPFLHYTDTTIFGFVPAWVFGRMGCTIAFDHPGVASTFVLAEMDRNGVVRHNLGFYEMLFAIGLTAILYAVRNVKPFRGFHTALMMGLYGIIRFPLDFLRVDDEKYLGLTPGQYFSIFMVVFAAVLFLRGLREKPIDKKTRR